MLFYEATMQGNEHIGINKMRLE